MFTFVRLASFITAVIGLVTSIINWLSLGNVLQIAPWLSSIIVALPTMNVACWVAGEKYELTLSRSSNHESGQLFGFHCQRCPEYEYDEQNIR